MKRLITLITFLCFTTIMLLAQGPNFDYKKYYDEQVQYRNWTILQDSPQLSGQWQQNGTVRLTINGSNVTWDNDRTNKSQLNPPGISQFEIVEIGKMKEYTILFVKRPEKYMNDSPKMNYYAIIVRPLRENQASFALKRGISTAQNGKNEYYHAMPAFFGIDDSEINKEVFFTYTK